MIFINNLNDLADHALRKLSQPAKDRAWKAKTEPFWHRGARGLEFELHPGELIDYYIFTHGLFEKRFLFLIESLFKGSATALDIGANIGNHAVFMSTIFDAVHSFEPNPVILERLKKNIARNKADNITLHEVGLSDAPGKLHFLHADGGNAGHSRFVEAASAGTKELGVERGDDIIARGGIGNIDFIKIDIEGHEIAALTGLGETIKREQPVVAFEFHSGEFPEGYFSSFENVLPGYAFFEVILHPQGEGRLASLKRGGLPALAPMVLAPGNSYENILAVPPGFDTARFGDLLIS